MASEQPKKTDVSLESILNDESIPDDQVVRIVRARMSWKDWIKYDFLRYWFGVGAFAFNSFLVLSIARASNVSDLLGMTLLIVMFGGLCILEYLLYRRIWPQGILTRK